MGSNVKEEMLAEYSALIEKINIIHNHQQAMLIFTFSAAGAIVSFTVQQGNPFIVLFAFVLLLITTAIYHNYTERVIQISTYIKVYLESEAEGLSWELRASEWRCKISPVKRDIKNYMSTITAVFLYVIYLIFLLENIKYNCFELCTLLLIPFFVMLFIWHFDYSHKNEKIVEMYTRFEKNWEAIKVSKNKEGNT